MQIICTFNLSDYVQKAKEHLFDFPDYSNCCPICGKKNCAVRIGYYYRWLFIYILLIKLRIPVARYLCKKTGKTFSLLPSQCIPYKLYDNDSLMFMAGKRHINNLPIDCIAAEFYAVTEASISVSTVFQYLRFFNLSHHKLAELIKNLQHDDIVKTVEYINGYTGGVTVLVEHIYTQYNCCFIFGTPSQLRR